MNNVNYHHHYFSLVCTYLCTCICSPRPATRAFGPNYIKVETLWAKKKMGEKKMMNVNLVPVTAGTAIGIFTLFCSNFFAP